MAEVFSESAFTQLHLMWGCVLFWLSFQSESADYFWEDGSFWNSLFILETFSSNTLRSFETEKCSVCALVSKTHGRLSIRSGTVRFNTLPKETSEARWAQTHKAGPAEIWRSSWFILSGT